MRTMMSMRTVGALVIAVVAPLGDAGSGALAQEVLVAEGSPMKYLANSANPGIALTWTAPGFNDALWGTGVYGVGYDTGPPPNALNLIATAVPPSTRSIYTRATFAIDDVLTVGTLFLGADWDDGYVAWINGTEVYRSPQMPGGIPEWNTAAGSHEPSNGTNPAYGALVNISQAAIPHLQNGTNVLAIGVWNASASSSDLVIVPQLIAGLPGPDPRGPYIQSAAPTSIILRWRTSGLQNSLVEYGPAHDQLTSSQSDPNPRTDHEVLLSDLQPGTTYYYRVGSSTSPFAGGTVDHYFVTPPSAGTRTPVRIWALGDSGTANASAAAVRNAYLALDDVRTDVWLMLGDNAYPDGTDSQYQAAVFDMYPQFLRNTPLWPTLGNHDAASAFSSSLTGPYYDMFTLPDAAEAGGLSSGTEAYYSFDHGNVHFICLNSEDVSRAPGGAMLTWLQNDLMATAQDWVIVYWHTPPYSKGSHDSDNASDSGGRLVQMRTNVVPILEAHGVDLVLGGHSHSYERSYLLDGHYGFSNTLTGPNLLAGTDDGRLDGDGAYQKATGGPAPHEGAVYVVAGTSGQASGGSLNHPAMFISLNILGSLVLDVNGDRLDGRFLTSQGVISDHFTMIKDTATPPVAAFSVSTTAGPAPLSVDFTDASSTNTASWSWDFDDDAVQDAGSRNATFIYASPGVHVASLTATNQGGSDIATQAICVADSVPGLVTGLTVTPQDGHVVITWTGAAGASAYDIIRGDLDLLALGGGNFGASVLTCLADGAGAAPIEDDAVPPPGGTFYYLVRAQEACGLAGTWDSGDPQQAIPRDPGIATSPQSCP